MLTGNGTSEIVNKLSQTAGGMLRLGSGVMGKSAVLLVFLMVVLGLAVWKLQPTVAIIAISILAVIAFFGWLFAILYHTHHHPDTALLEGAEWTAWKKFEASAKAMMHPPTFPVISDPEGPPPLPEMTVEEADK